MKPRELKPFEAELLKEIHTVKRAVESVLHRVQDMNRDGTMLNRLAPQTIEFIPANDPRWVAVAKTELQQGFMALERAVLKPPGF